MPRKDEHPLMESHQVTKPDGTTDWTPPTEVPDPVKMGDTVLYMPRRHAFNADGWRAAIVTGVNADGTVSITWYPRPRDPDARAGYIACLEDGVALCPDAQKPVPNTFARSI